MAIGIGTALLIGGAIKGVTELGKMWYGHRQKKKGLERQKQAQKMWGSRPTMEVPESVDKMISMYGDMATRTRLPGQDLIEGNIRSSTVTGMDRIQEMQSGAGGLGAVAEMVAREQDQFSNLGISGAQLQRQAETMQAGAVGQRAGWEQKAWEWNKAQPWSQKYAEAYGEGHAMEAAGVQNMWSAATGLGNTISDTFTGMAAGQQQKEQAESLNYLISQLAGND